MLRSVEEREERPQSDRRHTGPILGPQRSDVWSRAPFLRFQRFQQNSKSAPRPQPLGNSFPAPVHRGTQHSHTTKKFPGLSFGFPIAFPSGGPPGGAGGYRRRFGSEACGGLGGEAGASLRRIFGPWSLFLTAKMLYCSLPLARLNMDPTERVNPRSTRSIPLELSLLHCHSVIWTQCQSHPS